MLEIAHRDIVPAAIAYASDVAKSISVKKKALGAKAVFGLEEDLLANLSKLAAKLGKDIAALEKALADAKEDGKTLDLAKYYNKKVIVAMEKLRATADTLETLVDRNYWPLPSYGEILYSVK
jgi:glutamine synthetase